VRAGMKRSTNWHSEKDFGVEGLAIGLGRSTYQPGRDGPEDISSLGR
jgi:hypothetical protein